MKKYTAIEFWFNEIEEDMWWKNDPKFDTTVKERFLALHKAAVAGELYTDRGDPLGRLQEIILLDQFSRNMFRGTPMAFAFDTQALVLSQEAILADVQSSLSPDQKAFLYLPFMHSESLIIHERSFELFSEPGLEGYLEYEIQHKEVLEKFGRYPHRNVALGRQSTEQELLYVSNVGDF